MNKLILSFVLAILTIPSTRCQNLENIDGYLKELHANGKLNGNVLVIKNGETVYERSFGYADGSKNVELTKDYKFNIGSIYKEFPAVSIMQLLEQNKLKLDDRIADHIVGLPEWSDEITIKNLLQYSSGLPRIDWNALFSKGIIVNDNIIWEAIHSVENLEFQPGSDYLYSNMNPILLIKIVEQISQTNFKDYLKHNILMPYGIEETILQEQYPYKDNTLMAIPFNENFEEDNFEIAVQSLLFSSTTSDMASWFQQLEDFKIIRKPSLKILSETAKDGDNIQSPLGYTAWKDDQLMEHTHHGSSANYECLVRSFKQKDITIAILTNQKQQNLYEITDTILGMLKN